MARNDWRLWLKRAESNLRLAKANKIKGVVYEDLCFEAQQAAEKSIKAFLIFHEDAFPKVHSFVLLLKRLEKFTSIPKDVKKVLDLSDYAVQTRYPGDYYPVKAGEYRKAVKVAGRVFDWVCQEIEKNEKYYGRINGR